MGEGAGIVILESLDHALERGAKIYGEIAGYGTSCDAYHITSPAPDGGGAAQAMREALRTAEIKPDEVSYINAHGRTARDGETLRTAGGRVLSVTAVAPTAGEARSRAYAGVGLIHFEGARFRHDIGTAGGLSHGA